MPDAFVDANRRAVGECFRVDEPETQRRNQVLEQWHPAAQGDWTDHKPILVDQALL